MRGSKLAFFAGAIAFSLVAGRNASAGSNTGNLSVTSSVAQACVVSSTSTLAFGAYDPVVANASSALAGTGSVLLKCTKGSTGITIDLDAGSHASGTQRRMIGGTSGDFLSYNVTQPAAASPWTSCAGSTAWGSTTGGTVYTPTGVTWNASSAQAFTVCGSVPPAQNVSADGSYTDTVTVTVNF